MKDAKIEEHDYEVLIGEKDYQMSLIIDDIEIDNDIFQEEMYDYRIENREGLIENLIMWISEIPDGYGSDVYQRNMKEAINNGDMKALEEVIEEMPDNESRGSDKFLMSQDLIYLLTLEDKYIYSSISTNDYIAKSDSPKKFKNASKDIFELNETLTIIKKGTSEINKKVETFITNTPYEKMIKELKDFKLNLEIEMIENLSISTLTSPIFIEQMEKNMIKNSDDVNTEYRIKELIKNYRDNALIKYLLDYHKEEIPEKLDNDDYLYPNIEDLNKTEFFYLLENFSKNNGMFLDEELYSYRDTNNNPNPVINYLEERIKYAKEWNLSKKIISNFKEDIKEQVEKYLNEIKDKNIGKELIESYNNTSKKIPNTNIDLKPN